MPKRPELESSYQAKILRYLRSLPDAFVWKAVGGPFAPRGLPDVCLIYRGKFFGLEVKRPGSKPTKLQALTLDKIKQAGGIAAIVTTVDDVKAIIASAE